MTDIDAMEAAARAAHQGEWKATRPDRPDRIFPASGGHQIALGDGALMQEATANAAHIVATQPARVLPLIAEVRCLRAAVTVRWEESNDWEGEICGYLGPLYVGKVSDANSGGWLATTTSEISGTDIGQFPTEAEAKAALETAVSSALGLSE